MADEMLMRLQSIVRDRRDHPRQGSYTNELLEAGMNRLAQKVGEEGVEVAIAAIAQDDQTLLNELADLIYHSTVLLVARDLTWEQVGTVLAARHVPRTE